MVEDIISEEENDHIDKESNDNNQSARVRRDQAIDDNRGNVNDLPAQVGEHLGERGYPYGSRAAL